MKIIAASATIETCPPYDEVLLAVERATRTAYKSEDLGGTRESAERVIRKCLASQPFPHESVIEHATATVRFIVSRATSHELVRHRIGVAITQESQRYTAYNKAKFGGEITVIQPCFWNEYETPGRWHRWHNSCLADEANYLALLQDGAAPQEAREVLPNSTKTEVVFTANLREWRHVFRLRCDKAAAPPMREVMRPLLLEFKKRLPVFFEDPSFPTTWNG